MSERGWVRISWPGWPLGVGVLVSAQRDPHSCARRTWGIWTMEIKATYQRLSRHLESIQKVGQRGNPDRGAILNVIEL